MTYPHMWNSRRLGYRHESFRFFSEHAGGIVGRNAEGAFRLAQAEKVAKDRDWAVSWESDWIGEDPKEWCRDCERGHCSKEHECLCAVLRDAEGNILETLGGIWDPNDSHRRVIEAELALEAHSEEVRAWGSTPHFH